MFSLTVIVLVNVEQAMGKKRHIFLKQYQISFVLNKLQRFMHQNYDLQIIYFIKLHNNLGIHPCIQPKFNFKESNNYANHIYIYFQVFH